MNYITLFLAAIGLTVATVEVDKSFYSECIQDLRNSFKANPSLGVNSFVTGDLSNYITLQVNSIEVTWP